MRGGGDGCHSQCSGEACMSTQVSSEGWGIGTMFVSGRRISDGVPINTFLEPNPNPNPNPHPNPNPVLCSNPSRITAHAWCICKLGLNESELKLAPKAQKEE